jgi:hypothetical protein
MIFSVQVSGTVDITGEALDFRWFDIRQIPSAASFGFGQKKIVAECIRRLEAV